MIMDLRLFALVTLSALLRESSFVACVRDDCSAGEDKCTQSASRQRSPCTMNIVDNSLWCDHSNHTGIPDPDAIASCTSCQNASALYINDSCLLEIKRDELARYPRLQILGCRGNYVTNLTGTPFSANGELQTVDLSNNKIREMESVAFSGLRKLEELDLSNNDIAHIPSNSFRQLYSLKEISLHGNNLASVDKNAFTGLGSLRMLTLSANGITHIAEGAFDDLGSLRQLHLDQNLLKRLDAPLLENLTHLEVLTLSHNRLKSWPVDHGAYLATVHTLNLASNRIAEITVEQTADMTSLQNLILNNNSLTELTDDIFYDMKRLRYLDLSRNRLKSVGRYAFGLSCHLETLLLNHNHLLTPHADWFRLMAQNQHASGTDLRHNPWNCDCEAVEFMELLKELEYEGVSWTTQLRITCSLPKELRHKIFGDTLKTEVEESERCVLLKTTLLTTCATDSSFVRRTEIPHYQPIHCSVDRPPDETPEEDLYPFPTFVLVGFIVAVLMFSLVLLKFCLYTRRAVVKRDPSALMVEHKDTDSEQEHEKDFQSTKFSRDESALKHS